MSEVIFPKSVRSLTSEDRILKAKIDTEIAEKKHKQKKKKLICHNKKITEQNWLVGLQYNELFCICSSPDLILKINVQNIQS